MPLAHHYGMRSGRHTVIIELDVTHGPPTGLIRVDGGRESAFYGWIDLTARLEALMQEPGVSAGPAPSRVGPGPRG